MSRRNRHNGDYSIPDDVQVFAEADFDEFRHENKGYYKKKKMKKEYFSYITGCLSEVIEYLCKYGHVQRQNIQSVKTECYRKLAGDDDSYINYLIKCVEKYGRDFIPNAEFLPIILREIIGDILAENQRRKDSGEETQLIEPKAFYDLAGMLIDKRLKKAKKKGLDEDLMFDLLCVCPNDDAMEFIGFRRAREIFDIIYAHAADKPISFADTIEFLVSEDHYNIIIGYALQERKEKVNKFTESQKAVFTAINEWIFSALEDMPVDQIQDILENYIALRKRDFDQGKDGNRRYFISSLPESVYPKITKAIRRIKNKKPDDCEKFL